MTTIDISTETREKLNALKTGKATHDKVINLLIQSRATQEATITTEGRFENSKALKGKTILYKIKE